MLRDTKPYHNGVDWPTLILYFTLVIFGWANLYAANYNPDTRIAFSFDSEYFKQLVWIAVTLVSVGIIMLSDSKLFVEAAYVIYGFSLVLLLVVLVAGTEVYGAKSWLALGPVRFQPSEFTKIGTALVVSRILSRYGFQFDMRAYAKLFAVILVPVAFILLQNDTGSALVYFVFLLPMFREGLTPHILILGFLSVCLAIAALLTDALWVMLVASAVLFATIFFIMRSQGHYKIGAASVAIAVVVALTAYVVCEHVLNVNLVPEVYLLAGLIAMSAFLLVAMFAKRLKNVIPFLIYAWAVLFVPFATGYVFENVLIEHQRTRINVLFGIEDDPLGAGYNVNQSLIAIGSGGLSGKGFLQGTQTKLNFVPKQTTDFIFCTVGEEWGFLGSALLISVYLAFFLRIMFLAEKQHSVFSRVYGYCVASVFFFHFAINICMTIGLMPVIGIPLPFFSYGGSSLWGFSVMLFMFLKLDTDRNELIR